MARNLPAEDPGHAVLLARFLAAQGHYREAADALHETPSGSFLPGLLDAAEQLLRSAPSPASPSALPPTLGQLEFIYLHVGAPERVLESFESAADAGYTVAVRNAMLWHPTYATVRKTGRFKTLVRKLGLVDYWRARGWPEFCHPVGTNDFACS